MLIKIIRQKRSTKNRVILLYISASVATTRREPGWNLKLQDYWSAIIFEQRSKWRNSSAQIAKKIASKTQTIGKNVKNSIIIYNI